MSRLPKFILVLTTALVLSTLVFFNSTVSAVNPVPIIIGSSDSFSRYPIGLE